MFLWVQQRYASGKPAWPVLVKPGRLDRVAFL